MMSSGLEKLEVVVLGLVLMEASSEVFRLQNRAKPNNDLIQPNATRIVQFGC